MKHIATVGLFLLALAILLPLTLGSMLPVVVHDGLFYAGLGLFIVGLLIRFVLRMQSEKA